MNRIWLVVTALIVLMTFALGRAQAPAAPTLPANVAPRFQVIQLHPNAASEWSGLLDTQTGCVWAYSEGQNERSWQFIPVDADYANAPAAAAKQQAACDAKMRLPEATFVTPQSEQSH